jgi:cytochrome c oxidase assembly factor CtaG
VADTAPAPLHIERAVLTATSAMRRWVLVAGGAVIATALAPPLHDAADANLTAHMVQHVLLLTVAPPLLVLGAGRGPRSWRWLAPALIVHSAVLIGWHLPVLYDAAVGHAGVHGLEHLSLLAAGVSLWWALRIGDGRVGGPAVITLFVAALPGTALGAALTLAPEPWYRSYPSLGDQQGAGVVMWAVAGALYALAGGALVIAWLGRSDP